MFDYLRVLVTITFAYDKPMGQMYVSGTPLESVGIFWSWLCPRMVPFSAIWRENQGDGIPNSRLTGT